MLTGGVFYRLQVLGKPAMPVIMTVAKTISQGNMVKYETYSKLLKVQIPWRLITDFFIFYECPEYSFKKHNTVAGKLANTKCGGDSAFCQNLG